MVIATAITHERIKRGTRAVISALNAARTVVLRTNWKKSSRFHDSTVNVHGTWTTEKRERLSRYQLQANDFLK
jgi:hypothetical protein